MLGLISCVIFKLENAEICIFPSLLLMSKPFKEDVKFKFGERSKISDTIVNRGTLISCPTPCFGMYMYVLFIVKKHLTFARGGLF